MTKLEIFPGQIRIDETKSYFGLAYESTDEIGKLKEKYNKALRLLTEYNLPCEIDSFNAKDENLEYCSKNCSVDEEIFIKCWDRFIEQELESDK